MTVIVATALGVARPIALGEDYFFSATKPRKQAFSLKSEGANHFALEEAQMRTIVAALIGIAALAGTVAAPAQAMPIAPLGTVDSGVTFVAQGCGPGFYRGPYGHCHPMGYRAPGVVVGVPAVGVYGGYRRYPYAHPYYHPYAHPYYRRY
jgi:hypothetical protein